MSDLFVEKHEQYKHVYKALEKTVEFLYPLLPLANLHNTDFIIDNQWDKCLPVTLAQELIDLSDDELTMLPAKQLDLVRRWGSQWENNHVKNKKDTSDGKVNMLLSCGDAGAIQKEIVKPKWDVSLRPCWPSNATLGRFIEAARQHTLPELGVLCRIDQLLIHHQSSNAASHVVIPEFMSKKKCHEVDVMCYLCSSLAEHWNLKNVIDIGSGKGYLGCQLAFLHGLQVLGIDSSSVNTHSAASRQGKLSKHWGGLLRNWTARQLTENGVDVIGQGKRKQKRKEGKKRYEEKRENSVSKEQNPDSSLQKDAPTSVSGQGPSTGDQLTLDSSRIAHEKDICRIKPKEDVLETGSEFGPFLTDSSLVSDTPNSRTACNNSDVTQEASGVVGKDPDGSTTETLTMGGAGGNCRLYVPVTQYVTQDTDLQDLMHQHFPKCTDPKCCREPVAELPPSAGCGDSSVPFLLTGLHACGNLSASMMKLFAINAHAKVLCNVGCCYNHVTERYLAGPFEDGGRCGVDDSGFPMSSCLNDRLFQLGRNARMLAAQAPERVAEHRKLPSKSLYWRALLQVILVDITGQRSKDWQVGKIAAKCTSFPEYVQKSLQKLGMQDKQPSVEDIAQYENTYAPEAAKLNAFMQLKACLAPCVEAAILLDRMCFLLEQDNIGQGFLVQAFDPVTSPRCYAIAATKI